MTTQTATIDRLLTIKEVMAMVAIRKTKLYDMIQLEEFPEPIKLGSLSRWSLLEVQEWITQQKMNRAA
ncbi:MAG: AlpA family phage regulatory protein [Halopseudomonas sp.]|uniref:helix-turn-helix transcriptional regulator n=1 Tax=Halopseudomonas sp. TaxID=2901191 RepID=UPI003002E7A2